MAYTPPQPPNVNGLLPCCLVGEATFDEAMVLDFQTKLIAIQDAFVPSEETPVISTFYLVSEYNKANTNKINGDSAEFALSYTKEETV